MDDLSRMDDFELVFSNKFSLSSVEGQYQRLS
jgi:hypothetical protein